MKKLLLCLLVLSACGGAVHKPVEGTEKLRELHAGERAENCRRIYKIEVEGWANSKEDAMTFLKNRITESGRGNAFEIREVEHGSRKWWRIFGGNRHFEIEANVYNCN